MVHVAGARPVAEVAVHLGRDCWTVPAPVAGRRAALQDKIVNAVSGVKAAAVAVPPGEEQQLSGRPVKSADGGADFPPPQGGIAVPGPVRIAAIRNPGQSHLGRADGIKGSHGHHARMGEEILHCQGIR